MHTHHRQAEPFLQRFDDAAFGGGPRTAATFSPERFDRCLKNALGARANFYDVHFAAEYPTSMNIEPFLNGIDAKARAGSVFIVGNQTAGIGTKAHDKWIANDRNVAMTLALDEPRSFRDYEAFNLAIEIAVLDTVHEYIRNASSLKRITESRDVFLKLPNDILVSAAADGEARIEHKMCGILLHANQVPRDIREKRERRPDGTEVFSAEPLQRGLCLLGVGLNLYPISQTANVRMPSISLSEIIDDVPEREEVIAKILAGFYEQLEKYRNDAAGFFRQYQEYPTKKQQMIEIRQGSDRSMWHLESFNEDCLVLGGDCCLVVEMPWRCVDWYNIVPPTPSRV